MKQLALLLTLVLAATLIAEETVWELYEVKADPNKSSKRTEEPGGKGFREEKYERSVYTKQQKLPDGSTNNYVLTFEEPPAEIKAGQKFTLKLRFEGKTTSPNFGLFMAGRWKLSGFFSKNKLTARVLEGQHLQMNDGTEAILDGGENVKSATGVLGADIEIANDPGEHFGFIAYANGGDVTTYEYRKRVAMGELFDANPWNFVRFNEPGVPFTQEPTKEALERIGAKQKVKKGAAADGVSCLFYRAIFDSPGDVTISMPADAPGTLLPLVSDALNAPGDKKITVPTRAIKIDNVEKHVAIAIYRPPAGLGKVASANVSLQGEYVAKTGGARKKGSCNVAVVRPPVILVHGTYDDPVSCYTVPLEPGGATLADLLGKAGYRVFLVDWMVTNGNYDPSDFKTNEKTVWENKGGIRDALKAMHDDGYAATQVDLVCHSQGGVISRVYAKGIRSDNGRPGDHPHYTDPDKCNECWYHNPEGRSNYHRGDIRRIITISTTHFGSDICRFLAATQKIENEGFVLTDMARLRASLLNNAANKGSGIYTGGFRDQIPESDGLKMIGKTQIPAHAIACTADPEDAGGADGTYLERLGLIWYAMNPKLIEQVYTILKQPEDGARLSAMKKLENDLEDQVSAYEKIHRKASTEESLAKLKALKEQLEDVKIRGAHEMRAAVFGNCPNDFTVRQESSLGGLAAPYTTVIPHTLHGFAPRYPAVQKRVFDLLNEVPGDKNSSFSPKGFETIAGMPQAYGKYTPVDPAPLRNKAKPSAPQDKAAPPQPPAQKPAEETKTPPSLKIREGGPTPDDIKEAQKELLRQLQEQNPGLKLKIPESK